MKEQNRRAPDPLIIALIVLMTAIEAVLWASDLGLIGPRDLRSLVLQYAGFWPGLLGNWTANYPAQPYLMFATYAFLHGGPFHLTMNMVTLWVIGHPVVHRVGRRGFLLIYILSAIGGAMGYAALWSAPRPMVGASGALFGLAGAWLAWEYIDRFSQRENLWPVARVVGLLIALNVVMWYSLRGQIAWQTHLGGFIAGWLTALLIDPRPRETVPEESDAGAA